MAATLTESIRGGDQALAESLGWHEALGHFRTDRERQAFRAAFQYAWGSGVADWKLHNTVTP